ncbi:MAG: Peptidase S9 prolyl oligopeptidase active site domain protein [Thermotoga sp. 50_1627]|nr:MAG: Peptidase S9 prolyl oligopeptidase active site domain protein [Thermotoga sp. 50_64]KUK24590.1 MAG: Peptidase S9 prolyl oligopeptidase active site domain protein [Thermotoga sp. 50_1627]
MAKETNKKKFKVLLKYALAAITFFLAFTDFGLSLLIVFMVNIPLIRKAIFGRLVLDKVNKPWTKVETFEYMPKRHLDISYPNADSFKGVVLFAHGGGWISGYRRQPNNMSWYRFLVSQGFIVVAIDYSRGYISSIESLVEELTEAAKFMKRKFANLCNVKFSLMGLSAGGHLALFTGLTNPNLVDKIVAYYAPSDLMDIWESESIFARFSVMATIKRLPIKSKELYEKYSPINHVTSLCPKVLLVHGMKDSVVPYAASVKMFVKLKQNRCTTKLLLHPKGDHGFEFVLKDKKTVEILQRTVEFLQA